MTALRSPGYVDVTEDVPAEMRDGTSCAPMSTGRRAAPVPGARLPDRRTGSAARRSAPTTPASRTGLARRGYIVVGAGRARPLRVRRPVPLAVRPEAAAIHAADGYDTTEWAARSTGPTAASARSATPTTVHRDAHRRRGAAVRWRPRSPAASPRGMQDESRGIFEPIYLRGQRHGADIRARTGDDRGPRHARGGRARLGARAREVAVGSAVRRHPRARFRAAAQHLSEFLREQEIDRWGSPRRTPPSRAGLPCHRLVGLRRARHDRELQGPGRGLAGRRAPARDRPVEPRAGRARAGHRRRQLRAGRAGSSTTT